jgi:hypothetical protein
MANPTTNQRTTKAQRKEQARRERLELQRKVARARRNRRIGLVVLVAVAAGAAAIYLTRPEPVSVTPGSLFAAAEQARRQAGCGPVQTVGPFRPKGRDQAHQVSPEPLSSYPSTPPTSGPHNSIPLGAGIYDSPPPIDRLIHSLEHGAAVVWFSPDASGEELDRLREFYGRPTVGDRVIVAPYDYPDQGEAGTLPPGAQMALVAWHHLETCAGVSLPAAFDFTATYAAPPFGQRPYLGDAPEAGGAI